MRKFKDLLLSIVALLVSYGVYLLSATFFKSLGNDFLAEFLIQGPFAVMVFLSVLVLRKTEIFRSDLRTCYRFDEILVRCGEFVRVCRFIGAERFDGAGIL